MFFYSGVYARSRSCIFIASIIVLDIDLNYIAIQFIPFHIIYISQWNYWCTCLYIIQLLFFTLCFIMECYWSSMKIKCKKFIKSNGLVMKKVKLYQYIIGLWMNVCNEMWLLLNDFSVQSACTFTARKGNRWYTYSQLWKPKISWC